MRKNDIDGHLALILGRDKIHRIFFFLFLLSGGFCLIVTSLYYTKRYSGNPLTWASWLMSMIFLLGAYFPAAQDIKHWLGALKKLPWLLALLSIFFIASHLWNFNTAPWNENGIFDDAAWDIYFAKQYVVSDAPFQAAYFVDYLSKEVVFHYFITLFFMLFGYNLLVFNVALIILGLITFIFTLLLIHRIFNNYAVTIASAIVFNFLPTYFIQTFVGHRYAIAAPLFMSALYLLFTGYQNKSCFRVASSAVLAALSIQSAIMGKQFVIGLIAAMLIYLFLDFKKTYTPANRNLTIIFSVGLLVSLLPLIVYIYYRAEAYYQYERGLTQQFFSAFANTGEKGLWQGYIVPLLDIFLWENSGRRFWSPDFPLVPFAYYVFLIPGIGLAFIQKRVEIITLALLPVVGALVAGAHDFRVLHAVPLWIILMAFTFSWVIKLQQENKVRRYAPYNSLLITAAIILSFGLVPSINHVYSKAEHPNSIWLFSQFDVAESRFLRDIVAGHPHPSTAMKPDEFNKLQGIPEPGYQTFICQQYGYAVTHLFLQDYDDKKIMSFCNQHPIRNLSEKEVLDNNKRTLANYANGDKDLKLIWEMTDKTNKIITFFQQHKQLGSAQTMVVEHVGRSATLYILDVPKENIGQLKQAFNEINLAT